MFKKINVIGLGYIGLPTAAIFAKNGVKVIGIDINPKIVALINKGKIHIEEPGLGDLIKVVVKENKLKAKLEPEEADAFIISVPTPNVNDEYKSCDITYVLQAVKSIIPVLKKGDLIVIESTISPRTTEDNILPLIENAGFVIGKNLFLAHCPERVLPGQILDELVNNNRIIGGITPLCSDKAVELYKTFVKGKMLKTEAKTAEMTKLMENTFRDVNIALSNELTKICNHLSINALDVIEMANNHPRVNIHKPGPGVGGHCLAIDPYYIYSKAPDLAKIIKLARDTNKSMPEYVVQNVEKLLKADKKKIISVFGVTYKPNVDDIRESPSLEIIEILKRKGYSINIYDPHVKNINYVSFEQALYNSDLLLCLVGHSEFENINFAEIKNLMKTPMIFDVSGIIKENKDITVINYGNLYKHI